MFNRPLCWPYQPKPSLRAPKLKAASGACPDRHIGVWCNREANPLLQRPPSINQGHIQRILRGQGCLHVPDLPPPSLNGGQAKLILSKIAVVEPMISCETAKIRTTTTVEGIVHPFGTLWSDLRWSAMFRTLLCWPYQPKTSLRAPKLRAASGRCLDRRMGV